MSGEDSTLNLVPSHPDWGAGITFDMDASSPSSGHIVDAGSLRFNEEKRIEVVYSESGLLYGGAVADVEGNLVPVTFDVIVSDTSRAGMIAKADLLRKYVMYAGGGTLEYKPDGLAAGVFSTFYTYLQSAAPRLKPAKGNRWDAPPNSSGVYRVVLEVELMTLPAPTSDPASPVVLNAGGTAVTNNGGVATGFTKLAGSLVHGSLPALIRMAITPGGTGEAAIGRLWAAHRSRMQSLFDSAFNTSSAIAPTGVWSTPSDASRMGGTYWRCTPEVNEQVYGRRFTIADWSSQVGRAAIAVVVRSNAGQTQDWEVWYGWTIGNTVVYGEHKTVHMPGGWEVLLLGELDLPATEMSDVEDLDLYIDIYCKRAAGTTGSTFDIDGLRLLYTDEGAVQVDMPIGYGVSSSYAFLLENLTEEEIGHVVAVADDSLVYIPNVFGPYITFDPAEDWNRTDFIWERYAVAPVDLDFTEYDNYWKQISRTEQSNLSEIWTGGAWYDIDLWEEESWGYVGKTTYSMDLTASGGTVTITGNWNLGAWEDSDFIVIPYNFFNVSLPTTSLTITFKNDDSNYFEEVWSITHSDVYQHSVMAKKSAFAETGNADWGSISEIVLTLSLSGGTSPFYFTVDGIRMSKSDPDDADAMNDTGDAWDFANEPWHIIDCTEGQYWPTSTPPGITRAFLPIYAADPVGDWDCWAKLMQAVPSDCKISVAVWRDSETGAAGLWFRATDLTAGSEDGYVLYAPSESIFPLRDIVGGSVSTSWIAGGYWGNERDIGWWYMGVICKGSSIQTFASRTKDDLFNIANRRHNITDSSHAGTIFGLYGSVYSAFSDLQITPLKDLHVPADTLTVEYSAIFRTIYPFSEAD